MGPSSVAPSTADAPDRKPRDDEIDVYGLTHPGKVRPSNQDHFLIGSLRKHMQVLLTSLPNVSVGPREAERLAFLAMVADGVGGTGGGEEASRLAVEAITEYVAHATHCYYAADPSDEQTFARALEIAAHQVHAHILRQRTDDPGHERMATTLTMWIGVWPRFYILQVGDSRCYLLREGRLIQLSRDQTLAQDLVDRGVFRRSEAVRTPLAHVLSSALGGPESAPVVTSMLNDWNNVGLLCSDGLTKHVPDERIRERLRSMTSAKSVCENLLQDALDAGGTDNITVIVGRMVRKDVA
ncbi:MAG TPA: protein phosphatase 2C domain-containing protein [Gemmatimonadales bacterium]|nr:protein phosphatase 2C domain-containing protein [Gemmatimonadales bacterium]